LKTCKKEAHTFIIIPRPEIPDYLLPDEKEENPKGKGGEIPIELRDFKNVFNLTQAATLPHHQHFNHSIPLIKNTTPPYSSLYTLSRIKLEALQKFLKENLARG